MTPELTKRADDTRIEDPVGRRELLVGQREFAFTCMLLDILGATGAPAWPVALIAE